MTRIYTGKTATQPNADLDVVATRLIRMDVGDIRRSGAHVDGTTDDSTAVATADAAVVTAGGKIRFPKGTTRISVNMSIASDPMFEKGAMISVDSGKTVTFNGFIPPEIIDQIFTGDGLVAFGERQTEWRFEWFGGALITGATDPGLTFALQQRAAFQKMLDCLPGQYSTDANQANREKQIVLRPGTYVISTLHDTLTVVNRHVFFSAERVGDQLGPSRIFWYSNVSDGGLTQHPLFFFSGEPGTAPLFLNVTGEIAINPGISILCYPNISDDGVPVIVAGGIRVPGSGIASYDVDYITATASLSNVGNGGLFSLARLDTVQNGTYTITCTTAALNGGTFTVRDPAGTSLGTYVVNAGAFSTQIQFTIADGSVDFALGDTFTIVTRGASPITAIYLKKTAFANVAAIAKVQLCGSFNVNNILMDGGIEPFILNSGAQETRVDHSRFNGHVKPIVQVRTFGKRYSSAGNLIGPVILTHIIGNESNQQGFGYGGTPGGYGGFFLAVNDADNTVNGLFIRGNTAIDLGTKYQNASYPAVIAGNYCYDVELSDNFFWEYTPALFADPPGTGNSYHFTNLVKINNGDRIFENNNRWRLQWTGRRFSLPTTAINTNLHGDTVTLTTGSTYTMPNVRAASVFITEPAVNADGAEYWISALFGTPSQASKLVSQVGTNYSPTKDGVGYNLYSDAGVVTFQNNIGSTKTFNIVVIPRLVN